MKKALSLILMLAILTSLWAVIPTAYADGELYYVYTANGKPLNMRVEPNKNAKVLADAGAALLYEEKELVSDVLTNALVSLIEDGGKREKMSANIADFALPDANRSIYLDVCALARKSMGKK